jgi:nucleotide-binding universal stress UspA family protein
MIKFLVPIDGSEHSSRTVDFLLQSLSLYKDAVHVDLLTVQRPLPGGIRVGSALGHEKVRQYHRDEGENVLKSARARLAAAGVHCESHIAVGDPADVIVQYAREKKSDQIVIGARGAGAVSSLLLGSVATKVIHLAALPVLVVK